VQEQELLDDEEQEDDHWPARVLEVLQYLPQAHGSQRDEVTGFQLSAVSFELKARPGGVSSTVKLSVSKTELLGSNPSSPASLPGP
jgi:hypothetical protein